MLIMSKVLNPKTRRQIKVGGKSYLDLLKEGYEYDSDNNRFICTGLVSDTSTIKEENPLDIPVKKDIVLEEFKDHNSTEIIPLVDKISVHHIIHLADIHIPVNLHSKRLDEYEKVFNILYDKIKSSVPSLKNAIIVVAGDLLHTKLKLEPETITLARDFLYNLSKLTHTLVTIGNHDFTENNKDRQDSVTAIADRLNVHVLKNTGLYRTGDTVFAFNSLMDNKFIFHENIKHLNDKIYAIFHGTVVGSIGDNGRPLKQSLVKKYTSVRDFNGYDGVLLGHIHKHQFLTSKMAYVGSLIQQNYGEEIGNHGFILWDTVKGNGKLVPVENPYVHINLDAENPDKQLLESLKEKNLYIKVKYENQDSLDVLLFFLKENFFVNEIISVKKKCNPIQYENVNQIEVSISIDDEVKLIKQLSSFEDKQAVIDLHKKYHRKHKTQYGSWFPVEMKWMNLGIYGDDKMNSINFQTGISNICSGNMTGKSTIVNILLYVLFHKTSCVGQSISLLNKFSSKGLAEIIINHNGTLYKIIKSVRCLHRGKQKTEVHTADFSRVEGNISLNGSSQTETLKIIREYVGTIEQFVDANLISTRADVANILTKKPAELLKHFHRICDTIHYDEYVKQCSIDSREDRYELTRLKNIHDHVRESINKEQVTADLKVCREQKTEIESKLKTLNEKKDSLLQKMPNVSTIQGNFTQEYIESKIKMLEKFCYDGHYPGDVSHVVIEDVLEDIQALEQHLSGKKVDDIKDLYTLKASLEYYDLSTVKGSPKLPKDRDFFSKLNSIQPVIRSLRKYRNTSVSEKKEYSLDELEIIKGKIDTIRSKIDNFSGECIKSSTRSLFNLKGMLRPEVRRVTLPEDIEQQIEECRDIDSDWYKKYVKNNKITGMPLDVFLEHYNDRERLEKATKLNRLNDMIKINQDYEHNKRIEAMIRWVQKTELNEELDGLVTKLTEGLNFLEKEESAILRYMKYKLENTLEKIKLHEQITSLEELRAMCGKKARQELESWKNKSLIDTINSQLEDVRKEISSLEPQLRSLREKVFEYETNLGKLDDNNNNASKIKELEQAVNVYDEYKRLFDRKNIPAIIVKNKLQTFVDSANNIFQKNTNYRLEYNIKDDQKLSFHLVHEKSGAILEPHRLSGYETVVLQVALNKATGDIAAAHRSGLFMIDESLDCIDQERFNGVISYICKILRTNFNVTILISHRDVPEDAIDNQIKITSSGTCSYVCS